MNKKLQITKYVIADTIAAMLSWSGIFVFRKLFIEPLKYGYSVDLIFTHSFFVGLILLPVSWGGFYFLTGTYNNIFRKSRLKEALVTLGHTLVGSLIVFFVLFLDDEIQNYRSYYYSFSVFFALHFILTESFRYIIATGVARKIHNRKFGFNTLIIGSNQNAIDLFVELENQRQSSGFKIAGFVNIKGASIDLFSHLCKHLGEFKELGNILTQYKIEEVIVAPESSEKKNIKEIINELEGTGVYIKIIPDMYDIISGSVKMTSIFGAALIDIKHEIMPVWQQSVKRISDIIISVLALVLGSPFYLLIALIIKLSSKGSVFYSHYRVGINGKLFLMYKFRSMYCNAEKGIPKLASKTDDRITPFGRFMRKTRIDELPQFYNVLIGNMSIVGPRPERQYFIDKIVKVAPHYKYLHKIKPGITSWGQVKYGYAENVDEMVERLKYDVLYLENMSLFVDMKILIYTVLIVLQGRGK